MSGGEGRSAAEARIDETLDASYPASDPPSWTLGELDLPNVAVEPTASAKERLAVSQAIMARFLDRIDGGQGAE